MRFTSLLVGPQRRLFARHPGNADRQSLYSTNRSYFCGFESSLAQHLRWSTAIRWIFVKCVNQLLTKLDYLESWAFGRVCWLCGPVDSVGVGPWPLTPKSSSS